MKYVILICFILLAVAACNEPAKTSASQMATDTTALNTQTTSVQEPLAAYRWKLKELEGKTIGDSINGQEPYISFNSADSSVGGRVGCNRFGGTYKMDGDSIRFSRFFSTKMACADMSVENTFLGLIDSVNRFMANDKELHLMRNSDIVAIFEARPL